MSSVRVLSAELQELGEGPHWDAASQRLLIVDIDTNAVKFIDTNKGDVVEKHLFEDKVGAAIPYAANPRQLVVAVANRLLKYDCDRREVVEVLADVTEHEKGTRTRINDAKCDPQGRIVFGTMPYTFSDPFPANTSKLYQYAGGQLKVLLDDVSLSNGLAWSRNNQTFFYIDSIPNKTITAFDYSEQTGDISNARVLVNFCEPPYSEREGLPDGMTIDVQDNLWVATFGGGAVLKIDSRDGKLLSSVKIPSRNTTSVCFGGADLATLFVTSAGRHGVPEGLSEPQAGNTFAVTDLGTKGRNPVNFAG